MNNNSDTHPDEPEMSKQLRDKVIETFETIDRLNLNYNAGYPITTIDAEKRCDEDHPPTNEKKSTDQLKYHRFELLINATGQLDLRDILDHNGRLLAAQKDITITLIGTKTHGLKRYIWVEAKENKP